MVLIRSVPAPARARPCFEELEPRRLLAGYQPTGVEQQFLEELNDARANPAAYGAAIGVDLSGVAPSQPLAFNPLLVQAARQHSQDMNARGYFDHATPDGTDPGNRLDAVGFLWQSWGESLAGGRPFATPADALKALIIDTGIPDLGHRHHLLAMDDLFKTQTQVGIGIVQGGAGPLTNYYTIDSADSGDGRVYLTGVVYDDANFNGQYDPGEGLAGVTLKASGGGGSTTTFASGGFSLALRPGTYTVTASGGALAAPLTRTVTIGTTNVRLVLNPLDEGFIQGLYQEALGRPAGAAEMSYWLQAIRQIRSRPAVAADIEQSPEARTRLVRGWYQAYLGRSPVGGEEKGWVAALAAGATEEQVLTGILSSDEFFFGASLAVPSGSPGGRYVQALYQHLFHRTAGPAELAWWEAVLAAGGRPAVAGALLASGEYRAGVITTYYATLLKRKSTSPAEVGFWAASGLDLLTIQLQFEDSDEFFWQG